MIEDYPAEPTLLSAQLLQAALESFGEGIVIVDALGRALYVNPMAQQLLGLDPVIGPPQVRPRLYQLFDPSLPNRPFPEHERPIDRALTGLDTDSLELLVKGPRVREGLVVRVTARPIRDANGDVTGAVLAIRDTTELRRNRVTAAELSLTDQLTGAANRRAFDQRLATLLAEAARGRRFAAVMCDIDHFKRVNDAHGHAAGDEVLRAFAATLRDAVRTTDYVARVGGEEFCVLLADIDGERASAVAEKLRRAIEQMDGRFPITASFGVADYDSQYSTAETLLAAADEALYRAKSAGRNRVVLAAPMGNRPLAALMTRPLDRHVGQPR